MPRVKIDEDAYRILKRYKENLENRGVGGPDFSDAIREMESMIKKKREERFL